MYKYVHGYYVTLFMGRYDIIILCCTICLYNINDIDKYSHNIHYVTYVTLYIILYITLLTYYTTYILMNNSSS